MVFVIKGFSVVGFSHCTNENMIDASDFRIDASDFRIDASDFRIDASDFRTSACWNICE
jgi:hypothetical protein